MKAADILINSGLRFVPLQKLKEEDLLKLIATYGFPYELQHRDTPNTSKNCEEKEIWVKIFEALEKSRKDQIGSDNREIDKASSYENLLSRFLSVVRSENKQYQLQILLEMYQKYACLRNQRHGRILSRDQFWLKTKDYILCQGLTLGIVLHEFRSGKLHNN